MPPRGVDGDSRCHRGGALQDNVHAVLLEDVPHARTTRPAPGGGGVGGPGWLCPGGYRQTDRDNTTEELTAKTKKTTPGSSNLNGR